MSPDERLNSDLIDHHDDHGDGDYSQGSLHNQIAGDGRKVVLARASGFEREDSAMSNVDEEMVEDDADMQSVRYCAQAPRPCKADLPSTEDESRTIISDPAASTRSLWTHDLDYREIHGRLYCRDYYMPIDDLEQMRLTLIHQVLLHVLGPESTLVDLDSPSHILDVGTGTGEWAMGMAEQYPGCEVVGTDIAAVAETQGVPMNVFFEIEDAEDWDRLPDCYDLIHFRFMEGAFRDWMALYHNVFHSLKPGGWIEIQDFDIESSMIGDQFRPDSPAHALMSDLTIAAEKAGRPRGTQHMKPRTLIDAGFVDVRATDYVIPITVAEKLVGKIWLVSCLDAFEAICLRRLTEQMDWDPDDCRAACEEVARELAELAKDPETSKGLAMKLTVLVGRKPHDASPGWS